MPDHRYRLLFLRSVVIASLLVAGCAAQAPSPTPTKTPSGLVAAPNNGDPPEFITPTISPPPEDIPTETLDDTATPEVTETPEETPEPDATETPDVPPTWTPPPTQESLPGVHYWLHRPIPEAYTNVVDRTYPYGGTAGGQYRVHHGYEFRNPRGTPIVAPAPGTIVHAGDDTITQFGPQTHYYGYLVVMELDSTLDGDPIYLLFGHMNTIGVEKGQHVAAGDVLGEVGNSGVALGPHLHFEVREGDMYDFDAVRNPDLWILPFNGFGTLAGRVQDGNGNPLYGIAVTAKDLEQTPRYTWTYSDDTVQPDDYLNENFTLGDLPEGWYTVYINRPDTGKAIEETIFIEAGKTAWVEFTVE